MNRACDSGNPTFGDAAQMICIDLKTDRPMARRRCASRATRSEHLGEQDGYTAMQYPHGLPSARIDRRSGPHEIVTNLEKFNTEVGHCRIHMGGGQRFN
jgi:hypothetical protein